MKQSWHAAANDDAFVRVLRRINVVVPGRAEGRTKDHTERYSMARLMSAVGSELAFPLTVVHHDRPDFIVTCPETRIGVEHTEVVPENVAHGSFLREKGHGPDVYFLPRAELAEPRKTAEQLKAEIIRDEPSGGWYGNAPERETAAAIVAFAQAKLLAAQKPGFEKCESNWLLMYNNWPAPNPDSAEVATTAQAGMAAAGVFEVFDRVFVICSGSLLALDVTGSRVLALVDPGVES